MVSSREVAPGIIAVEYQIPGGKVRTKTVYDPARYTDAQMADLASQAATRAVKEFQITGNTEQRVKVGGVTFYVPITVPTKNISPKNPSVPRIPTAYPTTP